MSDWPEDTLVGVLVNMVLRYARVHGGKYPPAILCARDARTALWEALRELRAVSCRFAGQEPPPDDEPEPPLYMPLYIVGVPVFAEAKIQAGGFQVIDAMPDVAAPSNVGRADSVTGRRDPQGESVPVAPQREEARSR